MLLDLTCFAYFASNLFQYFISEMFLSGEDLFV